LREHFEPSCRREGKNKRDKKRAGRGGGEGVSEGEKLKKI